ncbi:MAG: terminase [Selenomonadaceae bacterium]|nr:terminase [Selenomonadaceae bacterium]
MAKDGTNRGGVRIGAGRKRKSIEEKFLDGQLDRHVAELEINDTAPYEDFMPPPPKDYLLAEQKGGGHLLSEQVYQETYRWLKSVGCAGLVTKQLVENYSMAIARHIQCEEILSEFGLLAKHPTTGEAIASPFVKMSIDYIKQASQLWYQIYAAVRDNSSKGVVGNEQNEVMENLLRRVK